MRTQKEFITIGIPKELHNRLLKDRDHFQEVIGGGKWSIADTINEIIKIADSIKKGG